MSYIEENDELLQKALGDYEVLSEDIVDYWDEAGGIPHRSHYSVFKIRFEDYDGNGLIMEHKVYEGTSYPFNSQGKMTEFLKNYCKYELEKECKVFIVDANDKINRTSDAEDDFDLRADLFDLFNTNPTSYISVSEKDDKVVKLLLDNFPKA